MARKKAFNRDQVLEKAMDLFWQKGYEATSIEDLVQCMGINRGSLYDTFCDKHRLFLAAIAHYDDTLAARTIAQLEAPTTGKQAIIDYFQDLIECAIADEHKRGCLLTNAAIERCPHDVEATDRIRANLERIEAAFQIALSSAQSKGELHSQHDLNALARFLASSVQGIRVMAKINPDRTALQEIADVAISVLSR